MAKEGDRIFFRAAVSVGGIDRVETDEFGEGVV
jgi:hypothetical protein